MVNKMSSLKVNENLAVPVKIPVPANRVTDVTVENKNNVTDEQENLDERLISAYPFPFDIFHQKIQKIIKRLSNALHVEPELIASTMLTIISGVVGNTIKISPKNGYEVPPFIWLIIIAESGYGKSPVINILLEHIKQLQAKEYQDYQSKLKIYETQLRKAKQEVDTEIPERPRLRHKYVSDYTVEALATVFEDDGRGVTIYQDEIAGLILGLNQYKSKGNDQQHYLELYNCKPWKIDRKIGVKFIPNTGASIIGGIQPKVMPRVFNTDLFDNGFIPRFLVLNAENRPLKFNRETITDDAISYWTTLLNWCYEIPLVYTNEGFVKPKVLILSSKALDVWEQFYNDYGLKMPFLSERARVFIPKLTAYYSLKFAGVLHIIEAFDKGASIGSLIVDETIQHAIELTHYFAGQVIKTLRLYEKPEDTLNEFQRRLIQVLYTLRGEVEGGRLALSGIVDVFNENLPEAIKHKPEGVRVLLRRLGLTTKKGAYNLSFLQWESEKMQKLFSKTTVTTVTTVNYITQKREDSNIKLDAEPVHIDIEVK